jgi:hypothetical protein
VCVCEREREREREKKEKKRKRKKKKKERCFQPRASCCVQLTVHLVSMKVDMRTLWIMGQKGNNYKWDGATYILPSELWICSPNSDRNV